MSMTVEEFHDALDEITQVVKRKDANLYCSVHGYVHWIGDEVSIAVEVHEPYNTNGYWQKRFMESGEVKNVGKLLNRAFNFAYAVPNQEQRALEFAIQKLHKLVEELPSDVGTQALNEIFDELRKQLLDEADRLAKHAIVHQPKGDPDEVIF